jgi:hypothetical protein
MLTILQKEEMLVKIGLKSSSLSLFEAEGKENGFYCMEIFNREAS